MSEFQDIRPLDPTDERERLTSQIEDLVGREITAAAVQVSDQWWSGILLVGDLVSFDEPDPLSVYNGSEVKLIVGSSFDGTRRLAQLAVSSPNGTLRGQYPLTAVDDSAELSQDSAICDHVLGRMLARTVFQLSKAEALRDRRIKLEVSMREPRNAGRD